MEEMQLQFEEFENLTGMFPDVLTYEAAEHEYSTGDWASKVEFCEYMKADKDGLARKIQRIANDRWHESELLIQRLREENDRLEDENDSLCDENRTLSDRVRELKEKIDGVSDIRTAMFCAESEMLQLKCVSSGELGVVHTAFDYLLKKLEKMLG